MVTLKIALRNIFRNKGKTITFILLFFFCSFLMISNFAFVGSTKENMIDGTINEISGHIQIIKDTEKDYSLFSDDRISTFYPIENDEYRFLKSFLQKHPKVVAFSERIRLTGSIETDDYSAEGFILGIEPNKERKINPGIIVKEGESLTDGDIEGIVLDERIAEQLAVDIGDTVYTLCISDFDSVSDAAFILRGISSMPKTSLFPFPMSYVTIENARYLAGYYEDDPLTKEFALKIDDKYEAESFASQLEQVFEENKIDAKAVSWEESGKMIKGLVAVMDITANVMNVIFVFAILIVLSNLILNNVLERTSEIGTMKAIGAKNKDILFMFLGESLIKASIGILSGCILGFALISYFGKVGIRAFTEQMKYAFAGDVLHPYITIEQTLLIIGMLLFVSMIATFIPASRAMKIDPIQAINSR